MTGTERCPECGAEGDWITREHETFGGRLDCIQRQAEALGPVADYLVGRIEITRDWAALARNRALGLPTPGLD